MLSASDEQVASSIRRLDPVDRTLLELSVRRGIGDEIIADVLRVDEHELVRRRDLALEALADYLGLCGDAERARLPAILVALPDRHWSDWPQAPRRRRRWPLVAAIGLLPLAGAAALVAEGGGSRATGLPGGAALAPVTPSVRGSGTATLRGRSLRLRVAGLPTREEPYEVWLYNSVTDAVPLARRVGGDFALAVGLPSDARRYRFVDVSREPLDGNPNHSGASVLRASMEHLLRRRSR